MSFAKKSGTATGDSSKGSASDGQARHSDDGGKPATANTPAHEPNPGPGTGVGPLRPTIIEMAPPQTPTQKTPPSGLTDTEKEGGVACFDVAQTKCEDGQDHSHDGFKGGCFHFGTQVTCGVCRGPNDLVSTNCGHPRTIIKTQVTQVPAATPGLTSVQLTNLSARIAQLQSLMSKPYGAECKGQIQTLLDVTQQALDAQNGFIADHLPTLQQGIPACYGSHAEQITETL